VYERYRRYIRGDRYPTYATCLEVLYLTYRTRIDIVEKILEFLMSKEKALKTHILYASNLNTISLNKYLDWLVKIGLVDKTEEGRNIIYTITPKGMDILEKLKSINNVLTSKGELPIDELSYYRHVFRRKMGLEDTVISCRSIPGKSGLRHTHLTVKYRETEYLFISINEERLSQYTIRNLAYSFLVSKDAGLPLLVILKSEYFRDTIDKLIRLFNNDEDTKILVI